MCGGGGGSELAEQAKKDEEARQGRINKGMDYLNLLFSDDPTAVGTGLLDPKTAQYNPKRTYYDAAGNPIRWKHHDPNAPGSNLAENDWSPYVKPPETGNDRAHAASYSGATEAATGGVENVIPRSGKNLGYVDLVSPGLLDEANMSEFMNLVNQGGVYSGSEKSGGWGDLYDAAYQAQLDYATPQVNDQFADAQRQLAYGLARQGISSGSSQQRLGANLAADNERALSGIKDQANQVRSNLQSSVHDEYGRLVSLLNQTGDNESVANEARSRAALLAEKPPMEAVGPYFQNATSTLADMIVSPALRQGGGGGGGGGYGGSSKGSGRVVNG